jgi:hypothetical protein
VVVVVVVVVVMMLNGGEKGDSTSLQLHFSFIHSYQVTN